MSFSTADSSEFSYDPAPIRSNGSSKERASNGGAMLSMDFSAPLAGPARSERLKQMSKNHPAFEKSRFVQEIIYKIQTSLRRMPGISANESEEIIGQLNDIGRVVNQETSQLVDALMNLTLDGEDTDKAIARMSLDANIAKATMENHAQTIRDLKKQLAEEQEKYAKSDAELKRIMEELESISREFYDFKTKVHQDAGFLENQPNLVKTFENVIQHLEDQVNNRRSLWVMKNRNKPEELARAIETMAGSIQDKDMLEKTLPIIRAASSSLASRGGGQQQLNSDPHSQNSGHSPAPSRAPSGAMPLDRPPTAHPSPYSPLVAGPPRAPSTRPQSRHFQSWGTASGGHQAPRAATMGNVLTSPGTYSRAPSRKGFQPQARNRSNVADFQHGNQGLSRPGTALATRDYYHGGPGGPGRARYGGRGHDSFDSGVGGSNGAIVPRNTQVGPLIHLTERSVAAWAEQISQFYSAIRQFVDNHADQPITDPDHSLIQSGVWPILVRTYLPLSELEAASYLEFHLRDQSAKRCLVTRVVVDYVVNLVWVPGAWKGADKDTTYALADIERDLIRTHGQPSSARQPLLDRQAAVVDAIMKNHEPGADFYKGKTEEITGTLLNNLEPLLNPLTSTRNAYADLMQVAQQAWDLSSKILTSRLTFDFRFPEIGSRFNIQSMVPISPADVDLMTLQTRHWRVAMVTTPVITCRNDTGTNISAHSVTMADVICMQ